MSGAGSDGPLLRFMPSSGASKLAPSGSSPLQLSYPSLISYQSALSSAVHEQLNLLLEDAADKFVPLSARPAAQLRASHGVGYYDAAELILSRGDGEGGGGPRVGWGGKRQHSLTHGRGRRVAGKRRAGREDEGAFEEEEEEEEAVEKEEEHVGGASSSQNRRLFLKVSGQREPSSACALDDVWLLAPRLEGLLPPQRPAFVRGLWHGPAANGMLEIEVLQPSPAFALRHGAKCVALRGPNASDFLGQLAVLRSLSLRPIATPPILPFLLNPRSWTSGVPPLALAHPRGSPPCDLGALLHSTLDKFRLNDEQATVLRRVAAWFTTDDDQSAACTQIPKPLTSLPSLPLASPSPPALLVHGVFGAGKSHLLVAVLWFLKRALHGTTQQRGGKPVRVMLAALTNVAVDNVLEGLIARAAEDGESPGCIRVGSLKRIAPAVLPHSTHGKLAADDEKRTRSELEREMRLPSTSAGERRALQAAIQQIDAGRMSQRARAIASYPIVGCTCASTGLPCLDGLRFDIVLLDESSQVTEPASLLPIARVQCERLLAVGDPMQLPPTLHNRTRPGAPPSTIATSAATSALASSRPQGAATMTADLTLTLFQRLAACGVSPVLLRRQYRCHPRISGLASRLFYGGQLRDGLGDAALVARAPLLPDLPTIGFAEVHGCEKVERDGSLTNRLEAERIVRLVGSLHAAGLAAPRIGVCCLYRAQAALCRHLLAERLSALLDGENVSVSTVDGFQGAERDVILVSPCRTAVDANLRFVSAPQRLNVTITRARHHLLMVGSASALMGEPTWATILGEAQAIPRRFCTGDGGELRDEDRLDGSEDQRGLHVDEEEEAEKEEEAAQEVEEDKAAQEAAAEEEAAQEDDYVELESLDCPSAERSPAHLVAEIKATGALEPSDLLAAYPDCELAHLLVARQEQAKADQQTRERTQAEMAARMDVGIRVNPALRQHFLGCGHGGGDGGVDGGGHGGGQGGEQGALMIVTSEAEEIAGGRESEPPPKGQAVDLLAACNEDDSDEEADERGALELLDRW